MVGDLTFEQRAPASHAAAAICPTHTQSADRSADAAGPRRAANLPPTTRE